ncbi:PREDICTED: ubiquitin carboxyl-terminal hydrolase 4-like, partial [Amphimedon queenslandica]
MISSKKRKLSNSDSEEEIDEKLMDQPKIPKQLLQTKDRRIRKKNQGVHLKPVRPLEPHIKKLGSEPCLWSGNSPPRYRKKSKSHESFSDIDKFPIIDKKTTESLTCLNDQISRSSSNNEIFLTPPSDKKTFDKRKKRSLSPKSLSQDAISKLSSDEFRSKISSDPAVSLSIFNKPSNPNTKTASEDRNSSIQLHAKLVEVESQRIHSKICGLKNLGNTCYMNSALQCLVHTEPLRELIEPTCTNGSRSLQTSQPSHRNLASSFSQLIKDMLQAPGLGYCNPYDLKKAIESHAPIFKGNSQQDAQELITLFIGGLHEEFNEITGKKPYVTMEVDESQFESEE